MKHILSLVLVLSLPAFAQSVKEKKARAHIDETFAEATKDVADCGKQFKWVYDWKSFDGIDFKKVGRDKQDTYGSDASNLRQLGQAVNALCADKDYKEALSKLSTIVYKPTANDRITVKAAVEGTTLTLENYVFGSTRGSSDYQKAAKDAL